MEVKDAAEESEKYSFCVSAAEKLFVLRLWVLEMTESGKNFDTTKQELNTDLALLPALHLRRWCHKTEWEFFESIIIFEFLPLDSIRPDCFRAGDKKTFMSLWQKMFYNDAFEHDMALNTPSAF